jgi:KUP system potassium uptake protein
MLLTIVLLYAAMRERWGRSLPAAAAVVGLFLVVDVAFAGANLSKITEGGWIPLTVAAALFAVMTTWRQGTEAVRRLATTLAESSERFLARLRQGRVQRTRGVAVLLTHDQQPVPALMVRHVAEFGALPADLVSRTVRFAQIPRVPVAWRVDVEAVADRFWHVTAYGGFVEVPNIASAWPAPSAKGDRELRAGTLLCRPRPGGSRTGKGGMARWRKLLFAFL